MSDVTGPIATLPGTGHHLPEGTMCDDHPDRPAVCRIQGDTDSFGSEMFDMCEECRRKDLEYRRSPEANSGRCDWCKSEVTDLRDARDYEEGMAGPVYQICGACQKRRNDRIQADLDRYDLEYGGCD